MDWATVVLDGLTLILDVLTLFIVITSFKAISANNRQSQETLAEGRRQAQAALDVAHEQIEQSKQQSQEILYNQNKPIIIWHTQTASSSSAKKLGSANDAHIYNLDIENVGTGIAANIWSVLCIPGQPPFICTYSSVLVPNRIEDASFYQYIHKFNAEEIEGYSFCPQEPGAFFRVVTTYVDIFNRKHLSIFERVNLTQWKQICFLSGIGQTLEDICIE